ncbi:MAG: hypothetical protein AABM33_05145 [Pseudomonadota bacterium]
MTDQDRDPKVSQRYRELGAEEPPRALDDAILAAARREAGARQRWYAPLATAAVLVLAVAVTLHLQVERPGIESPVRQAAPPPAAGPSSLVAEAQLSSPAREAAKEVAKPAAAGEVKIARRKSAEQPARSVAAAPVVPAPSEPKPFAADQAAASTSARSEEPRGAASSMTGTLARRAEAPANLQALKQADTPERELERIAELRGQGRHDEAEKALAEFRKRYPDYRIPEATRKRVERR